MTAFSLNLGFFVSGLLFAGLFASPAIGYRWFGLNGVLAFWFAYIVTDLLGRHSQILSPRLVRSAVSGSGTER